MNQINCGRSGDEQVVLVEPRAYNVDPTVLLDEPALKAPSSQVTHTKGKKNSRGLRKKSLPKPGGTKLDATEQPEVRDDSPCKEAYAFAQTPLCLREILTEVFENTTPGGLYVHKCMICRLTRFIYSSNCFLLRQLCPQPLGQSQATTSRLEITKAATEIRDFPKGDSKGTSPTVKESLLGLVDAPRCEVVA